MKTLFDIGLHKIHLVLQAAEFEILLEFLHLFQVKGFDLVGLQAQLFLGLHIHEDIGAIFELKVQLMALVHYMKQHDFVLVVFEVLQSPKKVLEVFARLEHIAKNHD